jgi:hypothetical protein
MFNPSLFYQFGSKQKYEPEYIAVLDYAVANGIQTPLGNQNFLNNKKIKLMKDEGVFNELDLFYYFKQQSSLSDFCRINWVNPNLYYLTTFGASPLPVFEANKGFKGTFSSSTVFNTNYTPSTNSVNAILNDMSFITKTYDEVLGVVMGTRNNSANNFVYRKANSSGSNTLTLCNATSSVTLSVFNDASHILATKNATDLNYYVNGTLSATTSGSSTSLSTQILTLFGWNLNGTVSQYFTGGVEYFGLGSSYLETKASQLATILN